MPLIDTTGQAAATPAPAPQPTYAPSGAAAAPTYVGNDEPLRFGSFGGGQQLIFNPPMEKSMGSEGLTRLQNSMEEVLKRRVAEAYTYKLIPVESGKGGLYYSVLILALQAKNKLAGSVGYYAMIMEASADAPAPLFINSGSGKQVEVTRPGSDAYDAKFRQVISDVMASLFGGVDAYPASATLVPRDFNIEDPAAVQKLTVNAILACHQELATREPGFRDVVLTQAGQDSTLRVTHRFDDTRAVDAVGNQIRSDVVVSFMSQRAKQAQQGPQSLNSGDKQEEVSSVRGFVDFVYDPVVPVAQGQWMMPQQQQNPDYLKMYAARFVATSFDFSKYYTIPTTLAALATLVTLRDTNNWYTAFYQRGNTDAKEIDLRDIGAIGYEINIAPGKQPDKTPYNTKSNNWQPSDLGQLLGLTFRPGLMISVDIPDCGPETWHEDFLSDAVGGSANALEAIYKGACVLTNNEFASLFDPTKMPIFADQGQRVHLGYVLDKENRKQDLRVFDYLGVLNQTGKKDPTIVQQWSDTWNNLQVPLAERLETRKKLLTAMNNTTTITGFATRVTFSAVFLDALATAAFRAGLRLTVTTPMASAEFLNQRGTATGVSSALMPMGQTPFVQQSGFVQTGGNAGLGGGGGGRWGR